MMATKEQERKALEQIRKIVEGLGEDSYLAAAFDGCFEMAESNITNDFCESYKGRFEVENKRRHDCEDELNDQIADLKVDRDEFELKYNRLKSMVFDADEMDLLGNILFDTVVEVERSMKDAAERIVENAEHPSSSEFKQAVEAHRASKVYYEKCQKLRDKAAKIMQS